MENLEELAVGEAALREFETTTQDLWIAVIRLRGHKKWTCSMPFETRESLAAFRMSCPEIAELREVCVKDLPIAL